MRRVERVEPFEEERALLRKEKRLARIDDELPGVGLDLREIRIHRGVERERVGDSPLHPTTNLR